MLWYAHEWFVSGIVIPYVLRQRGRVVKWIGSLHRLALYGGRDKGLVCRFFSTVAFSGQIPLCFLCCQKPTVHRRSCYLHQWNKQFFSERENQTYPYYRSYKFHFEYNLKHIGQHVLRVYLVWRKSRNRVRRRNTGIIQFSPLFAFDFTTYFCFLMEKDLVVLWAHVHWETTSEHPSGERFFTPRVEQSA